MPVELFKNFIKEAPIPAICFYISYLFYDKNIYASSILLAVGFLYVIFLIIIQVNNFLAKDKNILINNLLEQTNKYGESLNKRDETMTEREKNLNFPKKIEGYSSNKEGTITDR